jgi:hypothetical protein
MQYRRLGTWELKLLGALELSTFCVGCRRSWVRINRLVEEADNAPRIHATEVPEALRMANAVRKLPMLDRWACRARVAAVCLSLDVPVGRDDQHRGRGHTQGQLIQRRPRRCVRENLD